MTAGTSNCATWDRTGAGSGIWAFDNRTRNDYHCAHEAARIHSSNGGPGTWVPHGDTEFREHFRAEIEQTIRRLRNHPSVLLWVGGNEQYLWSSTADVPEARRDIFEKIMPDACRRLDPTRLFHTSSPYGGPTGNWPLEGDWHDYTTINFAPEASVPLFGSEVLRTSVPSVASMRRFLIDEEFWPKGFDPAVRRGGKRRGRPRVADEEAKRRRTFKAEWERYKETGPDATKKRFCEDEEINVEYLNNSVLRWCRDHPE
ncbi:MAG: hypothetical protein JXN61_15335 [Sedimentisphaerales bacterium]|nr:hypothetical protein [Sedimentisphaerales bacterium]